jgi:hypothetical protein
MLHRFHLFIDSFGLFILKQAQMQIGCNIDLKREGVVRINSQQLRRPGAEALTRFG